MHGHAQHACRRSAHSELEGLYSCPDGFMRTLYTTYHRYFATHRSRGTNALWLLLILVMARFLQVILVLSKESAGHYHHVLRRLVCSSQYFFWPLQALLCTLWMHKHSDPLHNFDSLEQIRGASDCFAPYCDPCSMKFDILTSPTWHAQGLVKWCCVMCSEHS